MKNEAIATRLGDGADCCCIHCVSRFFRNRSPGDDFGAGLLVSNSHARISSRVCRTKGHLQTTKRIGPMPFSPYLRTIIAASAVRAETALWQARREELRRQLREGVLHGGNRKRRLYLRSFRRCLKPSGAVDESRSEPAVPYRLLDGVHHQLGLNLFTQ